MNFHGSGYPKTMKIHAKSYKNTENHPGMDLVVFSGAGIMLGDIISKSGLYGNVFSVRKNIFSWFWGDVG